MNLHHYVNYYTKSYYQQSYYDLQMSMKKSFGCYSDDYTKSLCQNYCYVSYFDEHMNREIHQQKYYGLLMAIHYYDVSPHHFHHHELYEIRDQQILRDDLSQHVQMCYE